VRAAGAYRRRECCDCVLPARRGVGTRGGGSLGPHVALVATHS
jgi:hypothetical protein